MSWKHFMPSLPLKLLFLHSLTIISLCFQNAYKPTLRTDVKFVPFDNPYANFSFSKPFTFNSEKNTPYHSKKNNTPADHHKINRHNYSNVYRKFICDLWYRALLIKFHIICCLSQGMVTHA